MPNRNITIFPYPKLDVNLQGSSVRDLLTLENEDRGTGYYGQDGSYSSGNSSVTPLDVSAYPVKTLWFKNNGEDNVICRLVGYRRNTSGSSFVEELIGEQTVKGNEERVFAPDDFPKLANPYKGVAIRYVGSSSFDAVLAGSVSGGANQRTGNNVKELLAIKNESRGQGYYGRAGEYNSDSTSITPLDVTEYPVKSIWFRNNSSEEVVCRLVGYRSAESGTSFIDELIGRQTVQGNSEMLFSPDQFQKLTNPYIGVALRYEGSGSFDAIIMGSTTGGGNQSPNLPNQFDLYTDENQTLDPGEWIDLPAINCLILEERYMKDLVVAISDFEGDNLSEGEVFAVDIRHQNNDEVTQMITPNKKMDIFDAAYSSSFSGGSLIMDVLLQYQNIRIKNISERTQGPFSIKVIGRA